MVDDVVSSSLLEIWRALGDRLTFVVIAQLLVLLPFSHTFLTAHLNFLEVMIVCGSNRHLWLADLVLNPPSSQAV